MDKKDFQVVAIGEGKQENGQPVDSGAGLLSPATGLDVGPKASRGRHSRRQTLEKGMEDERHRAQVVSMEAFKAGRAGQVPAELLQMYDQLTRDQHALARTTTVLLASVRRALGLPDI
ncbi:hypothetical protein H3005_10030 [Stenotrophomonas sp. Br8]|uniref:hypothetical protein n=1 Tax=Stenotrophomonas sp. Br8 TaxID=2759658 RepID=UPI00168B3430|nr:hypothetical protein [Stenotrophomonas sp. Br8]MBD3682205.1 hypothetical protein [Stenotrophomonas sp. Br8]